jgi:fermentation-respiration switch protein FrsA (DUF1100 family)
MTMTTAMASGGVAQRVTVADTRVVVESGGWELIGNLSLPAAANAPVPGVLMLNKAAEAERRTRASRIASRLAVSRRFDSISGVAAGA